MYGLKDGGRFIDSPAHAVSLLCGECPAVWVVPLRELERIATDRGPRLRRQLVEPSRFTCTAWSVKRIHSPSGELLERVPVPGVVSNLCFGGADG